MGISCKSKLVEIGEIGVDDVDGDGGSVAGECEYTGGGVVI